MQAVISVRSAWMYASLLCAEGSFYIVGAKSTLEYEGNDADPLTLFLDTGYFIGWYKTCPHTVVLSQQQWV